MINYSLPLATHFVCFVFCLFVGFLWMACCKIVTLCWLFAWNDLNGGAQRDHHRRERHHWWSGRLGLVKCFFQDSESLCTLGLRYPSPTQDPRSVWLESDGWDLDFFESLDLGSRRWGWYFQLQGISGFLDELWGKCKSNLWDVVRFPDKKKHGGQSPVILNSGILRSGMSLYERSE